MKNRTAFGNDQSEKLAYTLPDFCRTTGVGRTSAYEEIAAGRLKTIKAAGRRLILREDAVAWLALHRDTQ